MSTKSKEAEAVAAAVEGIKLTLALATGTLVFGAALLKEDVVISPPSKVLLVVSWCLLGISVLAGATAFLRVPVMINEGKPDIHDKWLAAPGKLHHLAFLAGVVMLGLAMVLILVDKRPKAASENSLPAKSSASAPTNLPPR